ncbi:MAG: threonine synthase [Candidatus Puniceispirillaceae bacterium]
MNYISTRGADGPLSFEEALLNGLARDGGLYLPVSWPRFSTADIAAMKSLSYPELAAKIMAPFTNGDPDEAELLAMAQDAYADFTHKDVAPLTDLGTDNLHVLELFSGPTIAFKDYAMQFLSRAFDRALQKVGKRAVILGATSGDTGSAALEAFQGRDAVDVFILFPHGRVSPVQQKQMTSVIANGAHAIAVHGDFDDCQAIVKAAFNDSTFRDAVGLSAINSINWARLMPQIVYYFASALQVGAPEKQVAFSVPTGNFGNVFAGWVAAQMGLPIAKLIVASNRNDILTRFFETGAMKRDGVEPSLSPSMDIQVSSNFERLLFEMMGRDGKKTAHLMAEFAQNGQFSLPQSVLDEAEKQFAAYRLDDDGTLAEIAAAKEHYDLAIDPHSAVGLYGARMARNDKLVAEDVPIIALACAHPAKFPDAVERALGTRPALPPHLADLMERDERFEILDNDLAIVQSHILAQRRVS